MTKPVCVARDLFHVLRDKHLEHFLKNWGFQHLRKDGFFRTMGDTLWQVNVDFVRDGPRDQRRVDLFLGVGHFRLANFLKDCPILGETINSQRNKPLAIAANLASMHPREHREVWIFASSDPADVANVILDEMRTVGLDWFEKHGSLEQTMAAWEGTSSRHLWDTFYLSAAYWLKGDHGKAIKLVEHERDAYGPFEKKRALFYDVEQAVQFLEWLSQQPASVPAYGAKNRTSPDTAGIESNG